LWGAIVFVFVGLFLAAMRYMGQREQAQPVTGAERVDSSPV
jgi:Na+-transporting methylmalonyl-CoA/oxaloacetate decarboxylase gamma subunit